MTIHNFHEKPGSITIEIGGEDGGLLDNLFAGEHSRAGADRKHRIVLEGYGYRWYRVGGMGHLLKRQEVLDEGVDAAESFGTYDARNSAHGG